MATLNLTGAATTVDPGRPWQVDKTFLLQTKLDFSKSATGQLFNGQVPANADVLQLMRVLAGWAVHWGAIYVETACAGADTITVTYGSGDPNGLDNDVDLTSTGWSISAVGTDADVIGSPKVYSSDDTLDFTLTASGNGSTVTSGVVYVSALVTDLSDVSDVRMPAAV